MKEPRLPSTSTGILYLLWGEGVLLDAAVPPPLPVQPPARLGQVGALAGADESRRRSIVHLGQPAAGGPPKGLVVYPPRPLHRPECPLVRVPRPYATLPSLS